MFKDIHADLGLRKIINARGTYTPFGVSRSSDIVSQAVANALGHYFDMSDLANVAGDRIAKIYGVEATSFSHCAAGSITMVIAAIMTGADMERLYKLPDTDGIQNRVVIQAGHMVNFGQPIEQAVRLSGASIVVAGSDNGCSVDQLSKALSEDGVCVLLCVESRLCKLGMVPTEDAVKLAHEKGLPVVVDAAAQDLRLPEVIGFGADITITSAQKYLSAPTCGLALGSRLLTDAMKLQEKGLGRAMKPTKEGVIGALAAVEERSSLDKAAWQQEQKKKSQGFVELLNGLKSIAAECDPDINGLPFDRVRCVVDEKRAGKTAFQINQELLAGEPMISVQDHELDIGVISFEIVGLSDDEMQEIYQRLSFVLC